MNKIEKYLLDKNLQPHILGFDYIVKAIELIQKDKRYLRQLTTKLYPELAQIFNTTIGSIERDMRYCIGKYNKSYTIGIFLSVARIELGEQ